MYPSVTKVVPSEDFTLAIAFDNGEEGILDMRPYLGFGVFQRIADYFISSFNKIISIIFTNPTLANKSNFGFGHAKLL